MSLIFLLDSCESLDFFEFTLSLSDKLLTLLDEYFNDLAISTASISHECTFLLEGTYLRVKIIKSIIISASYYLQRTDCIFDVHLPISWRGHWIASSSQPQCCTFLSVCYWSSTVSESFLFYVKLLPGFMLLLVRYCTIGIWVNMKYVTNHLINLSVATKHSPKKYKNMI